MLPWKIPFVLIVQDIQVIWFPHFQNLAVDPVASAVLKKLKNFAVDVSLIIYSAGIFKELKERAMKNESQLSYLNVTCPYRAALICGIYIIYN